MKFIIFEGLDNCFKTTNVQKLRDHYINNGTPTHIFHYTSLNIPKEDVQRKSEDLYYSMFRSFSCLYKSYLNKNFICDRAHLGEWVYGKIYRNYDADEIFNIEKSWIQDPFWFDVYLVLLYDSNVQNIIEREDGFSISTDVNKKQYELSRFRDAFRKSNIINKIEINVNGRNQNSIFNEILTFIEK